MPSLPSTNKLLAKVVQKYAKANIKVLYSCPILLDFLTLFQMLCPELYTKSPLSYVSLPNFVFCLHILLVFGKPLFFPSFSAMLVTWGFFVYLKQSLKQAAAFLEVMPAFICLLVLYLRKKGEYVYETLTVVSNIKCVLEMDAKCKWCW